MTEHKAFKIVTLEDGVTIKVNVGGLRCSWAARPGFNCHFAFLPTFYGEAKCMRYHEKLEYDRKGNGCRDVFRCNQCLEDERKYGESKEEKYRKIRKNFDVILETIRDKVPDFNDCISGTADEILSQIRELANLPLLKTQSAKNCIGCHRYYYERGAKPPCYAHPSYVCDGFYKDE